mmetsp:Transcript_40535/g.73434  ORF Transcript_40535/g.73434 Transcript_40535/m.73434 type:complete len:236 (+) Transcript_40535:2236-2943(+)
MPAAEGPAAKARPRRLPSLTAQQAEAGRSARDLERAALLASEWKACPAVEQVLVPQECSLVDPPRTHRRQLCDTEQKAKLAKQRPDSQRSRCSRRNLSSSTLPAAVLGQQQPLPVPQSLRKFLAPLLRSPPRPLLRTRLSPIQPLRRQSLSPLLPLPDRLPLELARVGFHSPTRLREAPEELRQLPRPLPPSQQKSLVPPRDWRRAAKRRREIRVLGSAWLQQLPQVPSRSLRRS